MFPRNSGEVNSAEMKYYLFARENWLSFGQERV
jgi:hypothetical protein